MICCRLHVYTLYILRIIQNFPLSPMNKQDEETKGILNPTSLNTYIETKEGFYLQQIYMYLLVQSIMLSFQKQTALISLTQNSSETNKTWTSCNDFIIDNNGQKVIRITEDDGDDNDNEDILKIVYAEITIHSDLVRFEIQFNLRCTILE